YQRRKWDADCVVHEEFKDPEPHYDICKCTDADYECDYNFVRSEDRKECVPVAKINAPAGQCKSKDDKFSGPSGWRLIPGNDCNPKDGVSKNKPVERPCSDSVETPASGKVSHTQHVFKGAHGFRQFYYLERTDVAHFKD